MSYIKINEKIKEIIDIHKKQFDNENGLESNQLIEKNNTISWKNLRKIYKDLSSIKESAILTYNPSEIPKDFKSLFTLDDLVFTLTHREEIAEIELDPKVKKLRQRMKESQINRQYSKLLEKNNYKSNRLTTNIFGKKIPDAYAIDNMAKEYEKSISFGMMFLVSIFGGAFMGYFQGEYAFGMTYHNKLLMAGITAYATIIMEVCMFIIKSYKVDIRVSKQRKADASKKEVFKSEHNQPNTQNLNKVASKSTDLLNGQGDSLENSEDVPIQEKKLK